MNYLHSCIMLNKILSSEFYSEFYMLSVFIRIYKICLLIITVCRSFINTIIMFTIYNMINNQS